MGDFPPGKPLPDGEAYRDGWIEVTTGSRSAGDDSEGDADTEGPANLEEAAERCRTDGVCGIKCEGGDGCDTREAAGSSVCGCDAELILITNAHT